MCTAVSLYWNNHYSSNGRHSHWEGNDIFRGIKFLHDIILHSLQGRGEHSGHSGHRRTNICSADGNDGWIRYMRAIKLCLIDAVSSTRSFSFLLSAVETSLTTRTALEGASARIISTRVCATRVLAAATIRLFRSELPFYCCQKCQSHRRVK